MLVQHTTNNQSCCAYFVGQPTRLNRNVQYFVAGTRFPLTTNQHHKKKKSTCGRTAGATAAEPATSTCTMRAACVRAAAPAATAGLSPVETVFAPTPVPVSSWAVEAIPVGPDDDEIENDVDRRDNERPLRNPPLLLPPPPPPLLLLPSAMSVAERGIEGAEVSSEGTNAGGERRYRRGANAAESLNARRHTCGRRADRARYTVKHGMAYG